LGAADGASFRGTTIAGWGGGGGSSLEACEGALLCGSVGSTVSLLMILVTPCIRAR